MVCGDGDIRLRGAEPNAGIMEMCVSNVWRSVCASSQSTREEWVNTSKIACGQLDLNTQGVCCVCVCVLCACVCDEYLCVYVHVCVCVMSICVCV